MCLHNYSSSSISSQDDAETSESYSDSSDDISIGDVEPDVSRIGEAENMERRLFVCESTQLMDLVNQINYCSRCATIDCNSTLYILFLKIL